MSREREEAEQEDEVEAPEVEQRRDVQRVDGVLVPQRVRRDQETGRERIGFCRIVFHDYAEILQHEKCGSACARG